MENSVENEVRFLRSAAAYPGLAGTPECVETHMSWVFLAGDRVFKLKKPVRFPVLDFSTLEAREFYCREEVRLNARLAPGIYLGLAALTQRDGGMALVPEAQLPASATPLDWLVQMRRLPAERALNRLIASSGVGSDDIDALVGVLGTFYKRATRPHVPEHEYLARFQREQAANREVLLRPQFQLNDMSIALERFDSVLQDCAGLLAERAARGHVVDGHGDLRPEHVWLLKPPVVIDCLEFNETLRQVDPYDEIAFLALECEMTGAPWIGPRLLSGCAAALGDSPAPGLIHLYTAYRALLRARLAVAHLLDPVPRTPERWLPLAQRYVHRALVALDSCRTRRVD